MLTLLAPLARWRVLAARRRLGRRLRTALALGGGTRAAIVFRLLFKGLDIMQAQAKLSRSKCARGRVENGLFVACHRE
eukprot:6187927-Pleurochrysis_carterae.AAC.1